MRRRLARVRAHRMFDDAAIRLVAVGPVDHRSVRLWLRTDAPGPHTITVTGAVRSPGTSPGGPRRFRFVVDGDPAFDGTVAVTVPDDVDADDIGPGRRPADLAPDTAYTFEVHRGDVRIGGGRFVTAPRDLDDAPDEVAIGVVSCHQPFDRGGRVAPASLALLDRLDEAFDAQRVRQVLFLGDQVYADLPGPLSLYDRGHFRVVGPPDRESILDCSRAEVRALLQHRYRAFWKVDGFARLQSRFATVCTLDDHELRDNFGSDVAHATPRWEALRQGALDAFHDYQGLRAHPARAPRPDVFPTRFVRGPVAGLILDLRSDRRATDDAIRFLDRQWAALDAFLADHAEHPVLLLGLSVPLLHAPEWLVEQAARFAVEGSAIHDRWSHPKAKAERDRLVHRLYDHRRRHPRQHLILVSGDVHVGTASTLTLGDSRPIHQLVSSGLSNLEALALRLDSAQLARANPSFTTSEGLTCTANLLPGPSNPHLGLNAGVVAVSRDGDGWAVRLRLLGVGDREGDGASLPRLVFDSGPLGG
ncbi:MAG: alkaline phosphatase D family protein [Myxococcota bacterium]